MNSFLLNANDAQVSCIFEKNLQILPPSQYISTPRIQIGKIGGGGNDDFALKWMSLGTAPGDTSGERLSPPPPPPPRRAARQAPARRPGGRGGARVGLPRPTGVGKGGGPPRRPEQGSRGGGPLAAAGARGCRSRGRTATRRGGRSRGRRRPRVADGAGGGGRPGRRLEWVEDGRASRQPEREGRMAAWRGHHAAVGAGGEVGGTAAGA